MKLTRHLESIIAHFNPDHGSTDPEHTRQGRMLVSVTLIASVCAVVYGGIYVALGMVLPAVGAGSFLVVGWASLARFRRTGSVAHAGHSLGVAIAMAIACVSMGTGALYSPALCWYLLGPLVVALAAGRRIGLVWLGVACGMLALTFATDGWLPPLGAIPDFIAPFFTMLVPAGLAMATFAIAWSYESSRDQALGQVREATEEAERARDRAERAHEGARQVLDNVEQGLVIVDRSGRLAEERSAALCRWFDPDRTAVRVWDLFADHDPRLAEWLELGWEELSAPFMPTPVLLDQLPADLEVAGRSYRLEYRTMGDDDTSPIMLVVSDDTDRRVAARAEQAQRETMSLFQHLLKAPVAVRDFADEAQKLIERLLAGHESNVRQKRDLHTLKGMCATMGLDRMARRIHAVEEELNEAQAELTDQHREVLTASWSDVEVMLDELLGGEADDAITVDRGSFDELVQRLRARGHGAEARELESWQWRPIGQRLEHLADQSRALARRIDKSHVDFHIEAENLRHPDASSWNAFWSAAVHVVRNALDHGVEPRDVREAQGKSLPARVSFRAFRSEGHDVIEFSDDGAGIDWDALEAAARRRGLESDSLVDALFHDGVTTRNEATEISGRGVGMAAVRDALGALGGRVEVESELGIGTTFRFLIPRSRSGPPSLLPRRAA